MDRYGLYRNIKYNIIDNFKVLDNINLSDHNLLTFNLMKTKSYKVIGRMTMKNVKNWDFGLQIKETIDLLKEDLQNKDMENFLRKFNTIVEHVYKKN